MTITRISPTTVLLEYTRWSGRGVFTRVRVVIEVRRISLDS